MRRIDRKRRQQRENVGEKIIFEPGLVRLADIGTVDKGDAGAAERGAQFAPLRLLVFDKQHHGLGDANQLFGRRQTLRAFRADAGADLRPQTGDPHHEEFVQVVRGDRQKPQPLEQRVFAIGGFLKNAAIEIEPRQFTVDETIRARGQRRRRVPFCRLGEPCGRGQPVLLVAVLVRYGRCLAAVSHGYSLPLKFQSRRPL